MIGILLGVVVALADESAPKTAAEPNVVITHGCTEVSTLAEGPDIAYKGGVDADGKAVPSADLAGGQFQAMPILPDKVQVDVKAPFPAAIAVPSAAPEVTVTHVEVEIRPTNPKTIICPDDLSPKQDRAQDLRHP